MNNDYIEKSEKLLLEKVLNNESNNLIKDLVIDSYVLKNNILNIYKNFHIEVVKQQFYGQINIDVEMLSYVEKAFLKYNIPMHKHMDGMNAMDLNIWLEANKMRYEDNIAELKTINKWISVETLPENCKDVDCTDGKRVFHAAYYREFEAEVYVEDDDDLHNIICDGDKGICYMKPGWHSLHEQVNSDVESCYIPETVTFWKPKSLPPKP